MQIMSIGSAGVASVSGLSGGQSLSGDTAQISRAVNSAMNGNMSLNQDNLGISKEDFIMILSISSGDDKKHSSEIATLAIEMYMAGQALQAMNGLNDGAAASTGGVAGIGGMGGMGGLAGGMGGGGTI